MTSINEQVNLLHQAYCEASGLDLPLNPRSERLWYHAHHWGIGPEDVKLVVKLRMRLNSTPGSGTWSLLINRLIGDEADLDVFTNQLAVAKAQMRKKVFAPAKQDVLRATHRPDEPEAQGARSVSEVFDAMRKETA
jgi:hypothetical protein